MKVYMGIRCTFAVKYRAEHFELAWVVDGGFYPEHAAFVIHLHTVGL